MLLLSSTFGIGVYADQVATTTPKQETKVEVKEIRIELNPALRPVCGCESSYEGTWWGKPQQFEKNGSVRKGRINPRDIGMCQINTTYHLATSKKLKMDIYTEQGNIAYANYLYKHQGLKPWGWSQKCWTKSK